MQSLSDSFLTSLNIILQWVAIVSMALGLSAAIALFFVSNEMGRRHEQAIAELRPKPLKERILIYLDVLDPQILELARTTGQRKFERLLTQAQVVELQKFYEEDKRKQYIEEPGPTLIALINRSDTKNPARFTITDELVH